MRVLLLLLVGCSTLLHGTSDPGPHGEPRVDDEQWQRVYREHPERLDDATRRKFEFEDRKKASLARIRCRRDPGLCVPADAGIDGSE